MNRKLFLGIGIGSILGIAIIFGIYFFFFRSSGTGAPASDTNNSFFPYGQGSSGGYATSGSGDNQYATTTPQTQPLPKLRHLSISPVAGFTSFDRKATTTDPSTGSTTVITETAFRFIDRATGHVSEATDQNDVISLISNSTMPKFSDARFATKDSFVARRYDEGNDVIQTFVGSLVPTTSTSTNEFTIKGSFLTPNISNISLLGKSLFTFYTSDQGSSGTISNPIGSKETRVFSSPLAGWIPEYVSPSLITFTSKASGGYPGNLFYFNPQSKSFSQILGTIDGLTAKASSDGNRIIYSNSSPGSFDTYYKNRKTGFVQQLISVTLPEKCVWSNISVAVVYCAVPEEIPDGRYPDDWYKGLVSFADNLVKIDLDTNNVTTLLSLRNESGELIDGINLQLDPQENHLLFQNKIDYSLWSYDLRP